MIALNPEQLEAVQWSGDHLLVLAGPGTGKPRTIICRTAHLILKGTPANRIVV